MANAGASTKIVAHRVTVHPEVLKAGKMSNASQFACQDRPIDGSQGPKCYVPSQIQKAYGLTPLFKAGVKGYGRTVVIVDAFQNPYIKFDLSSFDAAFNLPHAKFKQIAPLGLTPFDPSNATMVGWAEEISLDIQWVHAAAPGAKIVLALAPSSNDTDLLATTQYVINHNVGDVISQSFGEAEQCMDRTLLNKQHALFAKAVRKGISVFASSGDSGASQFNCAGTAAIKAASTPASDPNVTGVGGTTLDAKSSNGAYVGETAWTEQLFGCNPPAVDANDINCSGGGYSKIYSRPGYQKGVPHTRATRGVPDVSYNAGVNGGVITHCSICDAVSGGDPADPTSFYLFGGTSSGSPQWAGITAVADQLGHHRLGNINPALYKISKSASLYRKALHDVTTGNNDVVEIGTGFTAKKNWDAVTGLGSPNAAYLLPLLVAIDR